MIFIFINIIIKYKNLEIAIFEFFVSSDFLLICIDFIEHFTFLYI